VKFFRAHKEEKGEKPRGFKKGVFFWGGGGFTETEKGG